MGRGPQACLRTAHPRAELGAPPMPQLSNPTDIARETLRQLAARRIAPTPDNYREHYHEISGHPAAPPSGAEKALRDLAAMHGARPEAAGQGHKLEQALSDGDWPRLVALLSAPPPRPDVNLPAQWRELLAQTLEFAVVSQLGHAPDLAAEATELAQAARGARAVSRLAADLKRFWYRLEMRGGEHDELHRGLLRLLRLMIDNTAELLPDDRWLNGQIALLQGIVARPLNVAAVAEAEKHLKEVIYKQGALRNSLRDAQAALKELIGRFIERLGELSARSGDYHDRLEDYAQRIRGSDNVGQLGAVLEEVMRDTRAVQLDVLRARDELATARSQAQAAEQRIRELETQLAQTSERVREDPLTGALNRRGLDDALAREAARADRRGLALCVALMDVDNFKQLNDALGHQAGDEALQHLTRVVKRTMRPSDVLARYGGEEFLLVLPETEASEAAVVMTRLQRNLTKAFFLHNNERVLITFSAGVAQRAAGEPSEEVIARADQALYRAKQAGKNRVIALGAADAAAPS